MDLDSHQRTVVEAPTGARILVEAGPGCGKTHVACERVAYLLNQGEVPDRILLLSFTRTAVHEIRNRIAAATTMSAEVARRVEVRTLDSFAWRLVTDVTELGSHDASIQNALLSVERAFRGGDRELEDWIKRFRHVLVDEAQDLVGDRASLIVALLNGLLADSGWTVFMDRAQAIYGWSSDAEDGAAGERFLELTSTLKGAVQRISLTDVHRTANPELLDLLRRARTAALYSPPGQRLDGVREVLAAGAGEAVHDRKELLERLVGDARDNTLVLFRRRIDALLTLSYIRDAGINCRLRIGGMPRLVTPWIAVVANELAVRGSVGSITNQAFLDAWQVSCHGWRHSDGVTPDVAWRLLLQLGATGRQVDLKQVARRLAMRIVPDAVYTREIGVDGAIIGTVHGSKGREAEHVILYLPTTAVPPASDDASDEEARVLYVGASRTRQRLDVLRAGSMKCGYHENRAWRRAGKGFHLEIGRDGDVDACTPLTGNEGGVAQQRLASFDGKICPVHVLATPENAWVRMLRLDDQVAIGALSSACIDALGSIVQSRTKSRTSSPTWLRHLTWLDTTTVALSPDDPRVETLPHPWRDTRLVLAPVVAGMGYYHTMRMEGP